MLQWIMKILPFFCMKGFFRLINRVLRNKIQFLWNNFSLRHIWSRSLKHSSAQNFSTCLDNFSSNNSQICERRFHGLMQISILTQSRLKIWQRKRSLLLIANVKAMLRAWCVSSLHGLLRLAARYTTSASAGCYV